MENLSDLQRLVLDHLHGSVDYAGFRNQFAQAFLSVHCADLEDSVNLIDGLCADLDEGDISEAELRAELSDWLSIPIMSVEVGGHTVSVKSRAVGAPDASGSDAVWNLAVA